MPPAQWKRREVPELRIVEPKVWARVCDRLATSNRNFIRTPKGQLVSKPERSGGEHLLSGFMVCGAPNAEHASRICGAPMTVFRHGKNSRRAYGCRDHREKRGCPNKAAVPYLDAHRAVIAALKRTFSPEAFEAHLAAISSDRGAAERRETERTNLLAEIARLAAVEKKLAGPRGAAQGDADPAQGGRAARDLPEGVELDIRAGREQVEERKATSAEWSALLSEHEATTLPKGTYGAVLARSVLRKILLGPILVTPHTVPVSTEELARACMTGTPVVPSPITLWTFVGVTTR